ncbi:MAG: hypothetical protein M1823_004344 [Watsoniomyces obsoletus]|nr:MAG: hypothetical protein M1823_004344 [Watsoniomyces obsoletus]
MRPAQRFINFTRNFRSRYYSPNNFRSSNNTNRRWQSTADSAGAGTAEGARQSTFHRMWNSPIGVKTVHFWAPVMKWALVLAGISDFYRPPEKLSLTQNLALTATGSIWTRWCLIIKPKNYLLAAVNFFLAIVGTIQVSRILTYRRSLPESSTSTTTSTTPSTAPFSTSSTPTSTATTVTLAGKSDGDDPHSASNANLVDHVVGEIKHDVKAVKNEVIKDAKEVVNEARVVVEDVKKKFT